MTLNLDLVKKLPAAQKAYILGGILATIIGLYWYLIYNPKAAELADLNVKYDKLQFELNEAKLLAADLPKFKAELEKLNSDLTKALLELPDKREIPTLLADISKLGTESGLEFIRFKPLAEVPAGFYAKVPVDINVKGPYHSVAIFFEKVSKMSRIVNMSDINIGAAKEEAGKLTVMTTCLATTYRFLETQAAKGGGATSESVKK